MEPVGDTIIKVNFRDKKKLEDSLMELLTLFTAEGIRKILIPPYLSHQTNKDF